MLFGYICESDHQTPPHFWTIRKGVGGYYECNDLDKIKFIPSGDLLSIDPHAVIFKFVRIDKLQQYLSLIPKGLTHYNHNSFINAAYQLAIPGIRKEINEHVATFDLLKQQQTTSVALAPPARSSNHLDGLAVINKQSEEPTIVVAPAIKPHEVSAWCEADWQRLKLFCNKSKKQFIIIVPSRSYKTDLTLERFARYVNESCGESSQILLLFGTNETQEDEFTKNISKNFDSCQKYNNSSKLYIKVIPFLWDITHKRNGKPPIGQMRNFCFARAHELWLKLTSSAYSLEESNIFLLSMDGDTQLTPSSFEYCKSTYEQKYRSKQMLLTAGYEILFNDSFVSKEEAISDENADKYWTALSNHIAMNINSRMRVTIKNHQNHGNYSGYPSEPLLCLSPPLTALLFHSYKKVTVSPTSGEAHIIMYLAIGILKAADLLKRFKIDVLSLKKNCSLWGQPKNYARPILHEYERFKLFAPAKWLKQRIK